MTRRTPNIVAGVLLSALAITVTACVPDNVKASPTETPSTPSTSPSTPSSTSATPTESPEQKDAHAAQQAVVAFMTTVDGLESDQRLSLSKLTSVSRDESATVRRQLVSRHRMLQLNQLGTTVIEQKGVDKAPKGRWQVSACLDVTKVNLVDKAGKSVVKPGRPNRVQYQYLVEKDAQKFYVIRDVAVGTC